MKANKLSSIILIALTATMIYSCKKDEPYSDESKEQKFENVEKLALAVDALYHTGAPTFYGESSSPDGPVAAAGGYLTGFFDNESTPDARLCGYCQSLTFDATNISNYTDAVWDRSYQAIAQANEIIERATQIPILSETDRRRYVAEALFFRAFNYFYLARSFGQIPVIRVGALNQTAESAPLAEVYQLIVDDLRKAIPDLPDATFSDNGFRISRPAAQTLLADVYLNMSGFPLQQNCYKQAADMARNVINNSKNELLPSGSTPETTPYNTLRTQPNNKEQIFSYRPTNREVSLSTLCLSSDAEKWGVLKTATHDGYQPRKEFLNIYDPIDDARAKEQQFFHSFFKYEKNGRTVIQTFSPSSYFWFDQEALVAASAPRTNAIIYRYAEVLLIAAEAIAKSEGVTPQAIGYLADVRARAHSSIDREAIVSELTGLGQTEFVEQVWAERLREFPLEMKLWTDIQRTRRYPKTKPTEQGKISFVDVIGAENLSGATFAGKHLLFPISQNILAKFPGVVQNE